MIPLRVTARLDGPIAMPGGPIALDALLAAMVAARDQLPPADVEVLPIDVPVAREPGGRLHLASFSIGQFEEHELRWINRRFPVPEAQMFGAPSVKTVRITGGPAKSYRLPLESGHLVGDRLDWYCIGECGEIAELLSGVTHLGKKRAVGLGNVAGWEVEPCEPWGDGFPVVRDGKPLRPLPPDWPGLVEPELAHAVLTYPYWERRRRELCAVPVWQ